jgi:hypothetical protein
MQQDAWEVRPGAWAGSDLASSVRGIRNRVLSPLNWVAVRGLVAARANLGGHGNPIRFELVTSWGLGGHQVRLGQPNGRITRHRATARAFKEKKAPKACKFFKLTEETDRKMKS